MQVITFPLGPVQANCYIYMDDGHAIVFDPGADFDIEKVLNQYQIVVDAIVLTHAHFDHIGGVDAIENKLKCPVYLNPSEFSFLEDPKMNSSYSFYMETVCHTKCNPLKEGTQMIGHFEVEAIYCPGHSCGSTVIRIGNCLFTGDVLFQGSIGRTDLVTGDPVAMERSLEKLKAIKENLHVLPGHGPITSLDQEKQSNFYLR